MACILAIDQGTTGSRVIAFDRQGRTLASAYSEFPQYFPKPGWVEHDSNEIWRSVQRALQTVLKSVSPHSVTAIGITNQRETTMVWDAQTGNPVGRAIVWQCRRTSARCTTLKKRPGLIHTVQKKTGLPIDAYFSGTKLEWILKHYPLARVLARQGRLRFGNPDAWLLWKLTGGQTHATDYTNASRTMLFNLETKAWDPYLLNLFNIPASILPNVKPSSGYFGKTVRMGALPAGIPITGMAGDQQAALFGQTCFEPGSMKNTYGTGCFMLLNTGKKRPRSHNGLITTLGCGPKGEAVFVLEGSVFIAGAAIQWLRDGLKLLNHATESQALAESLEDNAGVYFVPALVGLGAPYWDPEARGLLTGLTRGTTKAHVVRAALEAMAYSTRDILEAMQKDSGLRIRHLNVDGGAVQNRFLCQFQADVLGLTVVRPRNTELTALGAAYLAGLETGFWSSTQTIQRLWKKDRVFKPQCTNREADGLYRGWKNAIARVLLKNN